MTVQRRFLLVGAVAAGISGLRSPCSFGSANNRPVLLSPISFNANTLVNNANGTITGGTPADLDVQNDITYYTSGYNSSNPFPAGVSYSSPNGAGTIFAPAAAGQNNTMLINSSNATGQYNTPYSTVGTIYLATPMAIAGSGGFSILMGGINYGSPGRGFEGYTLTFSDGFTYTANTSSPANAIFADDYTSTANTNNLPVGTVNTATNTINSNPTYVSEYDFSFNTYYGDTINRKLVSITFETYDGDQGSQTNETFGLYALSALTTQPTLTWTGTTTSGGTAAWSTSVSNFTYNGTSHTWLTNNPYNVAFNDGAGSTNVSISATVNPGSVTFNNNTSNYVISGAAIGDSSYPTGIGLNGTGTVTFNNANTFTGPTNVNAGKLIVSSTGVIASNQVLISAGASLLVQAGGQLSSGSINLIVGGTLTLANHGSYPKQVIQAGGVSLSGTSGSWTGKIDLGNNDLIAHNGSIGQLTNQVAQGYAGGSWQGSGGITSSTAAAQTAHLTALGVIQNSIDQTTTGSALVGTFDGVTVSNTDVLIKYTYYGDTDLNGKVDGADYSRIDNASLNNQNASNVAMTGWFNGDFNYDGVINGSDYTLIDNAFNTQGAAISAEVANPTAQIAASVGTAAVPEPTTSALACVVALGLLIRRRTRKNSSHTF
jgi:autotransporter-associated beta strand protein